MKRKPPVLAIGDRVAYAKVFLQSTGMVSGDLPAARGIITGFVPLGETMLAEINWGNPNVPARVNTLNLSKVSKARGVEENN